MTPDPTSKILESLDEFVQKQKAELESQNDLLLERAKKEFEQLLSEQSARPLSLPRPEHKWLIIRKPSVTSAFSTMRETILKAWRKAISSVHRICYLISRRFKKNN
jgi:hypothetical protein